METRHRVLLVDDDPALLEVYRELLEQLPSRPEIVTSTSGARALALLKAESFRLLICDLRMPKIDGLQILAIVRRRFPELRTVVITAVRDEQYRSRAYSLGVDLFWLKPDTQQNMEMFLQCIESLLGQGSENGFRGIQSKSLIDILQMEYLSQSTTVLRITRGPLVGRIWIQGGEIIDAETEGACGEAAFRRILEWKSGTFENLPAEPGRARTITKPANMLLLEMAQAIDETRTNRNGSGSAEQSEQSGHRTTVWRLAALTREGAEFVVSRPKATEATAEGWGTEATQELGGWMGQALEACQQLSHCLQTGPLSHVQGRSMDHRIVMLSQDDKTFLVGWPSDKDAPHSTLTEQSKQLVASWES